MRLTNADPPFLLAYRSGLSATAEPLAAPGPLGPVVSTVPGLFCWLLFASAVMPRELPVLERLAGLFGGQAINGVIGAAWLAAVATSIAALLYYGRRPQVWHTTLCLGVHLAGVLFSVLLLGGLVLWMVF